MSASAIAGRVRARWSAFDAIGLVAQVREPFVAVVGDGEDLLGTEAAVAVLPDHRLEDQDHAGCEHDPLVEVVAEVGPDERHPGAVGPRPLPPAARRGPGSPP